MNIQTFDNINKIDKNDKYLIIENICNNLGLELDNIIDFTRQGLTSDKKVVNKLNYSNNKKTTYYYHRTDINGKLFEVEYTDTYFNKEPVYLSKDILIYKTNSNIDKSLIKECVLDNNFINKEDLIYFDNNKVLHINNQISDKNAIGYLLKSVGNIIIQNEEMTKLDITANVLLSCMIDYYFYNKSLKDLNNKIPLLYNTTAEIFYMALYNTITIFRYLLSIYEKTYIPLISIFIINDYYKIKQIPNEKQVNVLGVGFYNKLYITTEMINQIYQDISNGTCLNKLPNYEYTKNI